MKKSPSPPPTFLTSLLFISLLPSFASATTMRSLSRGSSLFIEDDSNILLSPNQSFTCGFYQVGSNAYSFSIWFSNSANKTVAWTANRDHPVNGRGSKVTLRKDGSLVLTDVDGSVVWSTNTSSTKAKQAELLESGNLVVKDPNGNILWQSFDSPTDTLLPKQPITKNNKLVSAITNGDMSSGYYSFYFDNDNVLKLIYNNPEVSSIYWPDPDYNVFQNNRTSYNSSRYGVLDELGQFTASDNLAFNASDMGPQIRRRFTLDYDGNLRLYSLNETNRTWLVSWIAYPQLCQVHGLCGRNGICVYTQSKPECRCPPNYKMKDPSDWSKGCQRNFNISCEKPQQLQFVELHQTDFWGYDLNYTSPISLETCKDICRNDCSCEAINYKMGVGDCFAKSALFNGKTVSNTPGNIYLKVPKIMVASKASVDQAFEPICTAGEAGGTVGSSYINWGSNGKTKWTYFYWFIAGFGVIEVLFIASGWWFIFRRGQKPTLLEDGYKVISNQFRKFTYGELKRVTKNFKDELGRGGSGVVYKGVLDDERVVAVKKLEDVIQGEEFWAEVSVIGRIYHMNLVRMWGFCSEGTHKLLVYEYVENSSLDKCLFSTTSLLGWSQRFKIAVGVAKGLAYLHHECLEWVIHCDVKPENILLDSDFEPKIADFGLAKLSKRGGTSQQLSRIRGTRGYMAPEWVSNLPITIKVDVYSYGVVLLELVKGSRVSTWMTVEEKNENAEFVSLVHMLKARLGGREEFWVEDFVDSRLNGQFNNRQAMLMLEIAISCLEEDRSRRPTMDSVIEMFLSCDG